MYFTFYCDCAGGWTRTTYPLGSCFTDSFVSPNIPSSYIITFFMTYQYLLDSMFQERLFQVKPSGL